MTTAFFFTLTYFLTAATAADMISSLMRAAAAGGVFLSWKTGLMRIGSAAGCCADWSVVKDGTSSCRALGPGLGSRPAWGVLKLPPS